MSIKITCPLPAAIEDLVKTDCAEHFGQIVKIAFQRVGYNFTDIADETEWDTLLSAADDTKIQISDFCENVLIPAGEAVTEGGDDNTTLFGQAIVVGKGLVTPTGRFRGITAESKRSYEQFASESSVFNSIGVYLINEFGQVIANDPTATPPAGTVFPIQSFFISDVDSQGFNTNNMNMFQWNFVGGWSDYFTITDLDFDIFSK